MIQTGIRLKVRSANFQHETKETVLIRSCRLRLFVFQLVASFGQLVSLAFCKLEMFPEATKKKPRKIFYVNPFFSLLKNLGCPLKWRFNSICLLDFDAKFWCFSCLTFLFKTIFTKFQKIHKELDVSFQNLLDSMKNHFKQKS